MIRPDQPSIFCWIPCFKMVWRTKPTKNKTTKNTNKKQSNNHKLTTNHQTRKEPTTPNNSQTSLKTTPPPPAKNNSQTTYLIPLNSNNKIQTTHQISPLKNQNCHGSKPRYLGEQALKLVFNRVVTPKKVPKVLKHCQITSERSQKLRGQSLKCSIKRGRLERRLGLARWTELGLVVAFEGPGGWDSFRFKGTKSLGGEDMSFFVWISSSMCLKDEKFGKRAQKLVVTGASLFFGSWVKRSFQNPKPQKRPRSEQFLRSFFPMYPVPNAAYGLQPQEVEGREGRRLKLGQFFFLNTPSIGLQ